MNREHFIELVEQYSADTRFLSYFNHEHPAWVELMENSTPEVIPWALELLRDWRDENHPANRRSPWLLMDILWLNTFDLGPQIAEEDAGKLDVLRDAWLTWGKKLGYIEP